MVSKASDMNVEIGDTIKNM